MNLDGRFILVTFGGGTNSTAMLIEMYRRGIKPNLILFADTGGEMPNTYCHVSRFSKWLHDKGMPEIITVQQVNKEGELITLEQECLERKALPSLAYGFKTCSQKYKTAPVDKYLNNHPAAKKEWKSGKKIIKFIGFDLDEDHRIKDFTDNKYEVMYPLVEWQMGRAECVETIKEAGLPSPGKSSCFYCPAMKKREIRDLKHQHPSLLQRAVAMENNAQENLGSIKGLGRNFAWRDFVLQGELFPELFPEPYIEESCGCYDGYSEGDL